MVSNSQEPELRAPDQEAKRDLEHTSAILVSDKNRSDEPDQRAVFHPGLREAVRNKLLEHNKSKWIVYLRATTLCSGFAAELLLKNLCIKIAIKTENSLLHDKEVILTALFMDVSSENRNDNPCS